MVVNLSGSIAVLLSQKTLFHLAHGVVNLGASVGAEPVLAVIVGYKVSALFTMVHGIAPPLESLSIDGECILIRQDRFVYIFIRFDIVQVFLQYDSVILG